MTCTPKMIVQYEWILENVEEEPKTIASKMILFRGEKVFRVSLKNHAESPVLFFMAINLNKIGMRVAEVVYGIQDSGNSPATMWQMTHENITDEGSLQMFTTELVAKVTGNCTFMFRICIEGILPCYSYRLSDRLAKDQLWAAATSKNPIFADVEFVVKDKKLSAHKFILAVRSPVFATEFTYEQPAGNGPFQIRIDDVDPSTVEQFLYFIYTGETMDTLANEDLLLLADKYGQWTLYKLCRFALMDIMPIQMVKVRKHFYKEGDEISSIIRPEKETEIFFDRSTTTFRCGLLLGFDCPIRLKDPPLKGVAQYQNENIFFAYLTGGVTGANESLLGECSGSGSQCVRNQPVIHCSYAKHRSFGLKVEDIYFSGVRIRDQWFKMESKNMEGNYELMNFATKPPSYVHHDGDKVYFDIKIISTIGNYYGEMMDDDWMKDFWDAATNQKFTDVEIFVGTVKLMEAHRVILSARSPVMNALLSFIGKPTFTIDAQFNVDIVKNFLKFLYTGFLEISANNKQLLKLATVYGVETLKNLCQLANRAPLDVEELTNSLLEL